MNIKKKLTWEIYKIIRKYVKLKTVIEFTTEYIDNRFSLVNSILIKHILFIHNAFKLINSWHSCIPYF